MYCLTLLDNPFDNEERVTGLGNKKKKTERERERQKLLDRTEEEKDQDIKMALRHGNTVEIIVVDGHREKN